MNELLPISTFNKFDKMFLTSKTLICDKHGEFSSNFVGFTQVWTKCPKCVEEKQKDDVREQLLSLEKERRLSKIKSVMNKSAVPHLFQRSAFKDFEIYEEEQKEIVRKCKYFADNFAKAKAKNIQAVFNGKTGTGKTKLACAIINQLINQGYTALFTEMQEILNAFHSNMHLEQTVINDLCNMDLLVIDEAGLSELSKYEHKHFYNMFNRRYLSCLPTIFISNNSITELVSILGDRTISRLQESDFILNFSWEDYRTRKNK